MKYTSVRSFYLNWFSLELSGSHWFHNALQHVSQTCASCYRLILMFMYAYDKGYELYLEL